MKLLSLPALLLQVFLFLFFFFVVRAKIGFVVQVFLTQRHALFGAESLRKIDAKDVELFRNGSVQEFYRLKALISFRNKWILQWKLRWWGYKLVGCCKRSFHANDSCDEHAVYFGRWLKNRAMFVTFLVSGNDVISLELIFVYLYKSTQSLSNTI